MKICMVGAQYNSANNGVNALTAGCMKLALQRYPDAKFSIIDFAKTDQTKRIVLDDVVHMVALKSVRMNFSKTFFRNNIFFILLLALVWSLLNNAGFKLKLFRKNQIIDDIAKSDLFLSISGGDSFSDIYGMHRYFCVILPLMLPVICKKKLVLMPQTYGPFKHSVPKLLSKHILNRAERVYARDYTSLNELQSYMKKDYSPEKYRFCYDVAFAINPKSPPHSNNLRLPNINNKKICVGFNVSGLLYRGGYSKNNMFGLKSSYQEIVNGIIENLLVKPECNILLVPHVFGGVNHFESDITACREVLEKYSLQFGDRIQMVEGNFDAFEIKYLIGMCDFFIGSRMHACIAALSQNIPAIGIAYSKKFLGLYQTIGVESLVADACFDDFDTIVSIITNRYENRRIYACKLKQHLQRIPKTHKSVFNDPYTNNMAELL
ncbi:hypothetical protein CHISP_1721 [Chitinispirillum alkaliphilum]|nr:hypothetical protein CHISP_1721 [Chitinispirillum alkaliphilum]